MKLNFLRKVYILLGTGFIYGLYKVIEKYGFSENTLGFIIAYFVIVPICFILPVKVFKKFKKSVGYQNSETKYYPSPDGKNIIITKLDVAYQIFIFLNDKLILDGDKEFGMVERPTRIEIAWIDNETYELRFWDRGNDLSEVIRKNIYDELDESEEENINSNFTESEENIFEEKSYKNENFSLGDSLLNIPLHIIFISSCIIIFLKLFSIEVFLFNSLLSDDLLIIFIYATCGLLYCKLVKSYFEKTKDKKDLVAGFLPMILSVPMFFLTLFMNDFKIVMNAFLLVVMAMLGFMLVYKFKKGQIIYSLVCLIVGSTIFSMVIGFTLFFMPALNTKYSVYTKNGKEYIQGDSGFLAAEWSVYYIKTSPITVIKTSL